MRLFGPILSQRWGNKVTKQKPHQRKHNQILNGDSWIETLKKDLQICIAKSEWVLIEICKAKKLSNLSPEAEAARINLKSEISKLNEILFVLRSQAGNYILKQIDQSHDLWLKNLDLNFGGFPPGELKPESLFQKVKVHAAEFEKHFKILSTESLRLCLLPDTNVFVCLPDVSKYRKFIDNCENYDVFLLPTVYEELDKQKSQDRPASYKQKLTQTRKMFKNYASRGKLFEKVKVEGDIYFGVEPHNPVFTESLSWLDPNHMDDRLLASAINFQIQHPDLKVVLLTADMGPYIKSEFLRFPCLFLSPEELKETDIE